MATRLTGIIAASVACASGGFLLGQQFKGFGRAESAGQPQPASSESSLAPAPPLVPPTPAAPKPPAHPATRYGYPSKENVLHREGFVVGYDARARTPLWVAEHLTKERVFGKPVTDRKKLEFAEDEEIPERFRAKLADYRGSGFDRGHLSPAADNKHSERAMNESFLLTNIAPQVGAGFNRDYWARLENFVRNLTRLYDDVYVVSGPAYVPQKNDKGEHWISYKVIGTPPNVSVPTHFYKVVLCERRGADGAVTQTARGAFLVPNAPIAEDAPLEAYSVPVSEVERWSGVVFYGELPVADPKALCTDAKCILPPPYVPKASPAADHKTADRSRSADPPRKAPRVKPADDAAPARAAPAPASEPVE